VEEIMKWTFNLMRVRGIQIKIHVTFLLILVLGGLEWGRAHGASGFAFGVFTMIALFACVTLHELGHSVAAQYYRIPVREIVLLPIGGVAMLGKLPEKPRQELIIAAAGPAVNVAIAAVLALVGGPLVALDGHGLVEGMTPAPSLATLVTWLLAANITLVVFNLIPAFPLDGGRMLRAVLAMLTDYRRATAVAAGIGQIAAIGLGLLGVLSGHFILALIAVFIFFGAGMESFQAKAKTVLTTRRIGDAYNKHALVLNPGDRLSTVVDYILTSYQPDFAVVLGGRLLGVVTRNDVLTTLAARGDDPYVAEIMQREVPHVEADAGIDEVQERMGAEQARLMAVYAGERFLGLVSREDLSEALSILLFTARREAAEASAEAT
jgi:Zn-dependent protease/predicted transcriptional regulator